MRRSFASVVAVTVIALASGAARAEDRADLPERLADRDTAYGRLDGDLTLAAGLGVTLAPVAPRPSAELRLRFLDTVGLFATYEDGLGLASSDPTRVLATGLELRPLFLARWLTGGESGTRWLDLTVDSFGLELGAAAMQPAGGRFEAGALQASLGLEVPLFGRASGLWVSLHGGARWGEPVIAGGPAVGPDDRELFLTVGLAYHQVLRTHLVDLHDRAP